MCRKEQHSRLAGLFRPQWVHISSASDDARLSAPGAASYKVMRDISISEVA